MRSIDRSISLIQNNEYGYCQETGDEIGIRRLLFNPTATLCVAVKAHQENIDKISASSTEDDDEIPNQ